MDHFTRLRRQVMHYQAAVSLVCSAVLIGSWWLLSSVFDLAAPLIAAVLVVVAILMAWISSAISSNFVLVPVRLIWQAILHVTPGNTDTAAPDLNDIKLGRELLTSLCLQVYQLASNTSQQTTSENNNPLAETISTSLPVPLLVMDKDQTILFANEVAHKYLGVANNELIGKNLYSSMDMSFHSNDTFDNWLNQARQNSVTNAHSWEQVHLNRPDQSKPLQFDLAAYYSKANPSGAETIIALFDHSATYGKEDDAISYVALAVHELRTPLTLLRGYIEVLQEDLAGKLDPELAGYLTKMEAAANRLTAFINNILNISRVEANQLVLQLQEENWNNLVKEAVEDQTTQAKARGKNIQLNLAENLPTVAADPLNAYEVLANLIDNALKYSGDSSTIVVSTVLSSDGLVETSVADKGFGIPSNVLPHLFEKFYRSHRTTEKVTGTGLGLYLSKVIVSAHGGQISVNSKEGIGTTISFTLKPYSQLAQEAKNSNNGIERNAYGWIKNHSLLRK